MATFVLVERRAVAPLVPWRVVRSRRLVAGNLLLLVAGMCVDGVLLVLTLAAQESGISPVQFGLTTAAMTGASVVGSFAGQAVVTRTGVRAVARAGMALLAVGSLALTTLPLVVGLVVFGAGLGAAFVSAQIAAVSGAAASDSAGGGIADTSFAVGGALGVAVLSTIGGDAQRPGRGGCRRRGRPRRGGGPARRAHDRRRLTSRRPSDLPCGSSAPSSSRRAPSSPSRGTGRSRTTRPGRSESTTTRSASSSASSTSCVTSTTARPAPPRPSGRGPPASRSCDAG